MRILDFIEFLSLFVSVRLCIFFGHRSSRCMLILSFILSLSFFLSFFLSFILSFFLSHFLSLFLTPSVILSFLTINIHSRVLLLDCLFFWFSGMLLYLLRRTQRFLRNLKNLPWCQTVSVGVFKNIGEFIQFANLNR